MTRLPIVLLVPLIVSACLKPAPPPAIAPPEVTAGTATVSLATLPPSTVAAWTGRWTSGARSLDIARSDDSLTANGQPLLFVGLGTFADPAGTSYLFGPDGTLRTFTVAGAETRWVR